MSNFEYDKLYDELLVLEEELGITMANSPTINVGYEVLSELPKEKHEKPMLSLDKTKEIERLNSEKEKMLKEIDRVEKKLSNQGFVAKAPKEVVEAEAAKGKTYKEMLEKVEEAIKALN